MIDKLIYIIKMVGMIERIINIRKSYVIIGSFLILLFNSCTSIEHQQEGICKSGIYYWKTIFCLSDWDKEFLRTHDIDRIYLRLFDVVYTTDYDGKQKSAPIATILFEDRTPQDIEIIPVVYITQDAIKNNPDFHELLYKRIKAMASKHGFKNFKEIQLDCDWTKGTRRNFFELCRNMCKLLHANGVKLSATIRLHQLKDAVPPVDCGVLMLYNTASVYDPTTHNSILSYRDVEPYIKAKVEYGLPLFFAYPTYSRSIVMRNNRFQYLLYQTDFGNNSLYQYKGNNFYKVKRVHVLEKHYMFEGDIIRRDVSLYGEIRRVKELVSTHIASPFMGSIVYHLDSMELSKFTHTQIEKILK